MVTTPRTTGERETLMLRGTIDMCVLGALRTPNHAYGVVQLLREAGFEQVSYGTIYPLVTRLRRLELVTQETLPSDGGPAKNVLSLTPAGRDALADWESRWHAHQSRVAALMQSTTSGGTDGRSK